MSNKNSPLGFRTVGAPIRTNKYRIAAGYDKDLFLGDLVALHEGTITKFEAVAPSVWITATAYAEGDLVKPTTGNGRYYTCTTAGTTDTSEPTWTTSEGVTITDGTAVWTDTGLLNACLGNIVEFVSDKGVDVDGYYPANSDDNYVAIVADAPNQLLIAQDDGDGVVIALTDIGKTGIPISSTAGNIITNLSGMEIDMSSISGADQSPTDPLILIDLVDAPDNALGDFAEWIVGINNHYFKPIIA